MSNRIPLEFFSYSVTPSEATIAAMNGIEGHHFAEHLPLAEIKFDFKNGSFILEGDWHFMMAVNRHAEQSWFSCHRERVKIEASIFPSEIVDLADMRNDGLAFALEGTLKDGTYLSNCTGLLILENVQRRSKSVGFGWNLIFYLYDAMNSECEIRMKLPVYAASANEQQS